jgi:hypothetical protein
MVISRKWGFMVVYETEMKSAEVHRGFHNQKGFDFAVVADGKGSLYVFEVFYVNIEKPFFRCGERLAELSYAQE